MARMWQKYGGIRENGDTPLEHCICSLFFHIDVLLDQNGAPSPNLLENPPRSEWLMIPQILNNQDDHDK